MAAFVTTRQNVNRNYLLAYDGCYEDLFLVLLL